MENQIYENYKSILDDVKSICLKANKNPENIKIIAVCKRQPLFKLEQSIRVGIKDFGENRIQDAKNRWSRQKLEKIKLRFLGPLQTNKSEDAVNLFDEVQSLDRPKLAKSLSKAQLKLRKKIQYMVQVNTGDEPQKSGIKPNELDNFIKLCVHDHGLNITGLMCIPPVKENPSLHFALMHELFKRNKLKHLSMGMSNDYQTAIEFGATHIRIGSKLFGERLEKEEHKS
jgi:pyridoxal phosphate enzyme (YggS family)|tara:strand:- start:235 stop:918 length:684 start_codon:yes stop_codon:yes gene_type:complete